MVCRGCAEGTLQNLLARFSPEFSMIAPATGTRVNAAGVERSVHSPAARCARD